MCVFFHVLDECYPVRNTHTPLLRAVLVHATVVVQPIVLEAPPANRSTPCSSDNVEKNNETRYTLYSGQHLSVENLRHSRNRPAGLYFTIHIVT